MAWGVGGSLGRAQNMKDQWEIISLEATTPLKVVSQGRGGDAWGRLGRMGWPE